MLKLIILLSIPICFLFSISLLESSYGGPPICGLEIAAGVPNFGSLQYLGLSADRDLTLRQPFIGSDTTATLKMRGADWLDGTSAKQMDAGHTKYENQSGVAYGSKTPLKTTDEILTYNFEIQPFEYIVGLQMQANLDTPGFTGIINQVITLSVSC